VSGRSGRHAGCVGPAQPSRASLQTDRAKLTHQHVLGGGFGCRGQHEVIIDAVQLSKVGKPVKLV
jgi:hypothetical protein